MRKFLAGLFCFSLLCCAAVAQAGSVADSYPDAPLTLVVVYTPGGATDLQARISALKAQDPKYFGQPMVILNKPGAGGMSGWNWFMDRGSKDGLTITAYNMPHFIAQSIVNKTRYNINTFEPLGNWGADPAVLCVAKNSKLTSVDELVKFAKENPGKLTINGAGLYVGHHIATLQLQKAAGIKVTYIPEKGGTDALQSVLSGKVLAGFNNLADVYRSQDRLTILAIADVKRHEFLPDVPTFRELGIDIDDASVNFRGYAMPKGVDPAIVDKAAKIVPAMFNDPEVVKRMQESGSPMLIMDREQVKKMFAEKQKTLEVLLKELRNE
ncbi:tripartite tricarboxylate transporter substrate binding protein [uncultured Desulfovibrio sp.]|uniref:tripartite tricarboxylate transporter substrate binding protein n=1 Tax=uncultured Desulfovibrio sp. TaxID=167968 RepID=UPI00261D4440|nr:tripartite tricarboxylate transporter substrate binding protein [uncultured Desulfovibrio sp.]